MFNIDQFFDILSTAYGKIAYSILAGSLGAIILVLFFNMMLLPETCAKLMPFIIGFNTACTGYMVIDKTRDRFRRKHFLSIGSGTAVSLLTITVLNTLFLHKTGVYLVHLSDLMIMVVVGMVSGWLGGVLAIKYFNLKQG